MPTFSKRRKAAFGSNRYCEVVLKSAVSLARGMFPQRLAGNPRELPITSHTRRNASGRGERYAQPRVDRRMRGWMAEQSYNPIITGEGGEPQGFGKEWPRDPLEGRGKQAYVSVERRHDRDSELEALCTQTSTE